MSTADAADAYAKYGKRVVFGDGEYRFWDESYLHNPKIAHNPKDGEELYWIQNYPTKRPYIKHIDKDRKKVTWNEDFRAKPGEIYLSEKERSFVKRKDYVIVEPNVKDWTVGFNKCWHPDYWQDLVSLDLPWVQMGPGWVLRNVDYVYTPTFREALAMLEKAALVVTTDGALHHAAAAMGVPAVVIWGGFVSPKLLGYSQHINICKAKDHCGNIDLCDHCRDALDSITPDEVKEVIKKLL